MIKRGLLVLLFSFAFVEMVSGLGLSPAIVELDYSPGVAHEITFSANSDDPEQEIELFLGGELSKYANLSTKKLIGSGSFKVLIKFPDSIELVGRHDIGVGAREASIEQGFIGTKVEVIGAIRINIPYPGKYAEIDLNIRDGNVKEQIPVEVYVINRGEEDFDVDVNVNFLNEGRNILNIQFDGAFLKPNEERYFRKFLDTSEFKPGNYIAEAVVNYGKEAKMNRTFRIGSLYVNVTNFTQALPKDGINRFFIDLENIGNNNVDEVYADVNIANSPKNVGFRTPSTNLERWEKKTLVGFLDTSELEGNYKIDITLYYSGQKSSVSGELVIFRERSNYTIALVIALIVVFLTVLIVLHIRKREIKRKRR